MVYSRFRFNSATDLCKVGRNKAEIFAADVKQLVNYVADSALSCTQRMHRHSRNKLFVHRTVYALETAGTYYSTARQIFHGRHKATEEESDPEKIWKKKCRQWTSSTAAERWRRKYKREMDGDKCQVKSSQV